MLPATMRYMTTTAAGGPEVLVPGTTALPQPAADEVLLRVQAAGVNRPDVLQRKGLYPPPPGASPIIGLEVAGVVVAMGTDVRGVALGDRVCALANGGGYAEYCAVPATQCLPWPRDYDAVRAAALPETFFTVWANLFLHGRFRARRDRAGAWRQQRHRRHGDPACARVRRGSGVCHGRQRREMHRVRAAWRDGGDQLPQPRISPSASPR